MKVLITNIKQAFPFDADMVNHYTIAVVKIIFILILSKVTISITQRVVSRLFKLYPRFKMDERKSNTLTGVLNSVIKYIVYLIAGISILNVLGIPTQPILATAGLGGIAIGFGAQSLVKDVVTGFFILFEDQYSVGDYVTLGSVTGTVEDMGLRITKIRSFGGELHIIPNGEVKIVTNLSRGNSLAIIDTGISYEEDVEKAMHLLEIISEDYYLNNKDLVIEKPEVLGVINFGQAEVTLRTIAKTKPLMHWKVERAIKKAIVAGFKSESIEMPYPKHVLINK